MKIFYKINKTAKTTLTALVLATIITIGFYACKKPNEGVNLLVNTTSLSKAPLLLIFSNANASSATQLPASFAVTISGPGAQYVQTDGGGNTFKVSGGILPLSLKQAAAPSAANPVIFNVYAEIPGFAPISESYSITNETQAKQSFISVLELANLPAGTSMVNASGTLSGGTATTAIKIATTANSTLAETATITIPAGTKLLDANGNLINATTLSGTVIQFGTSSPTSADVFPGGLNAPDAIGSDGKAIPGGITFINAGTLAINLTAGTTPVKFFSQPIQISIELQNGLINQSTGNAVKAGETLETWSRNENTGQWKSESTATIALNTNNKLAATTSIAHLSVQSIRNLAIVSPTPKKLNINLLPSVSPWVSNSYYVIYILDANNNIISNLAHAYSPQVNFFETYLYFRNEYEYSLISKNGYGINMNAPATTGNVKVVVYESSQANGAQLIGQSAFVNIATTTEISVPISAKPIPNITAYLDFKGKCPNKQVVVTPQAWLKVTDLTTKESINVQINGTIATMYFNSGDQYVISTVYDGSTYSCDPFIASKTGMDIYATQSPTFSLTGTTTKYKISAIGSELSISLKINLQNCN